MGKSSQDKAQAGPDIEAMSFEDAAGELESIVDRIESGEIGLEASLDAYERGMKLKARCQAILERAEQRIAELTPDDGTGDGQG